MFLLSREIHRRSSCEKNRESVLETGFEGAKKDGERHKKRVDKIRSIEEKNFRWFPGSYLIDIARDKLEFFGEFALPIFPSILNFFEIILSCEFLSRRISKLWDIFSAVFPDKHLREHPWRIQHSSSLSRRLWLRRQWASCQASPCVGRAFSTVKPLPALRAEIDTRALSKISTQSAVTETMSPSFCAL